MKWTEFLGLTRPKDTPPAPGFYWFLAVLAVALTLGSIIGQAGIWLSLACAILAVILIAIALFLTSKTKET